MKKKKEQNDKILNVVAILCSVILFVVIGLSILSENLNPILKLSFLLSFGLWGAGVGMIIIMNKIKRGDMAMEYQDWAKNEYEKQKTKR